MKLKHSPVAASSYSVTPDSAYKGFNVAMLQVGKVRGMAILVACLRSGNTQTYENATGALWNVGLDVNNTAALQAVSAPGFLAQPVPSTWCTDHVAELSEASEEEAGAEEGEPLVGPFITQNPV